MSVFTQEVKAKIEGYLTRYETRRSAILPILHVLQDAYGWIQPAHVEALESEFQLHKVEVQEVATFYSMYRLEKPAQFRVLFCDNIVCNMLGANKVIHRIEAHIARYKEAGNSEPPFSVQGVPCLGVCDGAPAMLVNKERHLRVTEENIDEILAKYAPLPKSTSH
jgi:NADH-quinone oxidoreductase subunit E